MGNQPQLSTRANPKDEMNLDLVQPTGYLNPYAAEDSPRFLLNP